MSNDHSVKPTPPPKVIPETCPRHGYGYVVAMQIFDEPVIRVCMKCLSELNISILEGAGYAINEE